MFTDIAIGLAYFSIPILLFRLWKDRLDFPFRGLLGLFAAFIFACGATHFLAAWNMWHADYWLAAGVKAVTALISVVTAAVLYRNYTSILNTPSAAQLLDEIEKRKLAEEKLERVLAERTAQRDESRTLVHEVVAALPSGLIVVNDSGQFLHFNSVAHTVLGGLGATSLEELTQQTDLVNDNGEQISHGDFPLTRALRGDFVDEQRLKIGRSSGERTVITCSTSALSGGGAIMSFQDVTNSARLEQKLRVSNEELERFAHVASHDLKEPLRGVVSCLGILQELAGDRLEEEERDFLLRAMESGARMREMIEGLLTYSTLGHDLVAPCEIDCRELALSAVHDHRLEDAVVGPLPTVEGHKPLLQRLFHNLIGNSIKYKSPDRRLELEIKFEDGTFRVADNGQGIDPRHQAAVFEIYRRLHSHSEIPGTGLGLAMCRRIVEFHGGSIWIESQAGHGTAVCFTLEPGRQAE